MSSFIKEKTGVVLLGASDFPDSKRFNKSEAFYQAKERIKKFLLSNFFENQIDPILDLFDSDEGPSDILLKIKKYIKDKQGSISDLIIYYVGHGGFDNEFLLAIRKTDDELLSATSLTAKNIGKMLTSVAADLKIFLILDCCFAAEMYSNFQSPVDEIVKKQIAENFPENGLAMLCSSSREEPSLIISDRQITMFTEAFETALRTGDSSNKNQFLTLRELRNLTFAWINKYNPDAVIVRPEVHSPIMPVGDIAEVQYFPNYAYNSTGLQVAFNKLERFKKIQDNVVNNNLKLLAVLFIDFVNDFDKKYEFIVEAPVEASNCNTLDGYKSKPTFQEERVALYRRILTICQKILTEK